MKRIIFSCLFFLSAILFAQIKGKVISIKDGDTIVALLETHIAKHSAK